jgi:hypothetical protein
MKIEWLMLRPAVLEFFKFYTTNPRQTWTGEVKIVYAKYYRAVDRQDEGSKAIVEDAAENWDEFATKAVFEPRSRFDNKSLQVQGIGGNRWIHNAQELRADDEIVSIVHEARAAPVVSRFQVVVKAEFAGQELYDAIARWASSCSAVSQWKVLNPVLGSKGPDSTVFYLNRPLQDQTVQALLIEIAENLRECLEDLNPPPFGLECLCKGIYGIDVPSNEVQRNKLLIAKDYGSAGSIISSIVCKAAFLAANDLYHRPERQQHQEVAKKWGGEENYIKEVLRNVLQKDFQPAWELVN